MAGRETRSPGLLNVLEEQTRNRRKTRRAPRAGARPARRRGGKPREPPSLTAPGGETRIGTALRAGTPQVPPKDREPLAHSPDRQGSPSHTHGEGAPRTGNPLTHTGNPSHTQGAPHTHTQTRGAPHASTHAQGAPLTSSPLTHIQTGTPPSHTRTTPT